jgi:anaerobic magnesium-protoporphyrin IX monomethyl ester cyclase
MYGYKLLTGKEKVSVILLMTTAPPEDSPWIFGRKLLPLGLAYVGAALEKANYKVEMIDNYMLRKPLHYIKSEVKRLQPEMVGITCGSVTYKPCIETAKAIKEASPSCKVVVGGWHPSYLPETMLQHPEIDYVVMGEGERAIVELANSISKGEDSSTISKIAGVACRHNGKVVKNPSVLIEDLDEIPFPARHLLPMDSYLRDMEFLKAKPVDTMNVIRGCPYSCAFCDTKGIWGPKCRMFSPQRIVDEVEHMVENYGTRGLYFIGDNFTINKKRTTEFCQLLKSSGLDVEWICDTRVDLISRDLLKEMRSAGCRTIWFGVESGTPHILKKLNKGVSIEQTEKAFKLCRQEDINISCSLMLGIPGETVSDIKATFNFAKKLNPDWIHFNIFVAYPGSSLYDEVIENKLYDKLEDFVAYVKTDEFNYDMLLKMQRQFLRDFHKAPRSILQKIRRDGFLTVLKRNI